MKTLTQRALELATEKQERAWERACKATNEGAKRYWTNLNDKTAQTIIKLNWRLKGE